MGRKMVRVRYLKKNDLLSRKDRRRLDKIYAGDPEGQARLERYNTGQASEQDLKCLENDKFRGFHVER